MAMLLLRNGMRSPAATRHIFSGMNRMTCFRECLIELLSAETSHSKLRCSLGVSRVSGYVFVKLADSRHLLCKGTSSGYYSVAGCRLFSNTASAPELMKQKDISGMLDLLDECDATQWTAEQTWLFTKGVLMTHYASLCDSLPWLQANIHVGYIQLHLRDNVRSAADVFHMHRNYDKWYNLVMENADEFNDVQLADCFLAAAYLGVQLEDDMIRRLLLLMHIKVDEFSMDALSVVSVAIKALPGFDFFIVRAILNRFESLVSAVDPAKLAGSDLVTMANVCINMIKFMSDESIIKFLEVVSKCMERDAILVGSCEYVGTLLRLCQSACDQLIVSERQILQIIIEKLVNTCSIVATDMTTNNIAEVCNSLKFCRAYNQKIASVMEARAVQLLTKESRLCDVTNLMYSLSYHTSEDVSLLFQGALHSRLVRAQDVDIVILSNIADVLNDMRNTSNDLVALIQSHIASQSHDIMTYITRFNKILKFLLRRKFIDREAEAQFTETLLDHYYNDIIGIRTRLHYGLSSIALFLITSSYESAFSQTLFNRIMTSIPDWHESDLCRLMTGINGLRAPINRTLRREVSQVCGALQLNLVNRLDTVESLHNVLVLAFNLLANNPQRDPTIADRVMEKLSKLTVSISEPVHILSILRLLTHFQYYAPEVYNNVTKCLLESQKQGNLKNDDLIFALRRLICACSKIGYLPTNASDLLELSRIVYEKLHVKRHLNDCVELLRDLSVLQLFPEAELSQLFTLEEIEDIERYATKYPEYTKSIGRHMMELNRNVVIECPQLDVPWFHDEYFKENAFTNRNVSPSVTRLQDSVYDALVEMLGGEKYLLCSTSSPYYYSIDFECVINANRKPMQVADFLRVSQKKEKKAPKYQRYAICVMPDWSYCFNSKQLVGSEQVRKRHLEIMEYKFIEVPSFDWYSMALTDWSSKVNYLRAKIFS